MTKDTAIVGWSALLEARWFSALAVLVGGVLLHSMNVLMLATVLPSVVDDIGGASLLSWTSTAYLASSIVAATCTGYLTANIGARNVFCIGALVFGVGAIFCALAPSMALIVIGRFVQGFGGGLLAAIAYVLVRNSLPGELWPRAFALLSGAWSLSIVVGPMVGGVFAQYGSQYGGWRGVISLMVAGIALPATGRFLVAGPAMMAAGLLGIALLLPLEPAIVVFPAIFMLGAGIGSCWAFIAQRVMGGARKGEEDVAASSIATVQQTGFALGAAVAGLVANAAGLSAGLNRTDVAQAALWVPACFVLAALLAATLGARLARRPVP